MKVKELIKELQELPGDMEVFVRGYEGGYAYAYVSDTIHVALNVNSEWYYGPHEEVDYYNRYENKMHVVGVVIDGK